MTDCRVVPEEAMTKAMDDAIKACLCACFPADAAVFAQSRAWHGSAPAYSVVATDDKETLLGHIGMVKRTVAVGGMPVTVVGVQNFGVRPEQRGREVGPDLLAMAADEAARRGISYGLLFCIPALERYYRRFGWQRNDVAVTMDFAGQCGIPLPGKNITMTCCFADEAFPVGPIHLNGPDW